MVLVLYVLYDGERRVGKVCISRYGCGVLKLGDLGFGFYVWGFDGFVIIVGVGVWLLFRFLLENCGNVLVRSNYFF